jgi:hypothetical protein
MRRWWAFALGGWIALGAWAQGTCPPAPQPFTPEMFDPARPSRDRGPMWRIERDGRTSFLYGTLHVGRRDWLPPGPAVRTAFQQARVLALEIDPLDIDPRAMAAFVPRRGATPLGAALQARLDAAWAAECLPREARVGPPEMQAVTLVGMAGRREGYESLYGSEIVLALMARGAGRAVVALESVEEQMRALEAETAAEAERLVEETLEELKSGRALRVLRSTAQVWESADLEQLQRYEQWCECVETEAERRMMKRLLDDRNPRLAERIEQLHASRGPVLAAVGALHMIGPAGLPELLRRRGFRVERMR